MSRHGEDIDRTAEWDAIRARHLKAPDVRPATTARGVHHLVLLARRSPSRGSTARGSS